MREEGEGSHGSKEAAVVSRRPTPSFPSHGASRPTTRLDLALHEQLLDESAIRLLEPSVVQPNTELRGSDVRVETTKTMDGSQN